VQALESYERCRHTGCSDIVFAFQIDDDTSNAYINHIKDKYNDRFWLYGNVGFVVKVNGLAADYPGYDAYMVLNDDQVIQTKDFDKILMDKLEELEKQEGHELFILSWRDGINNEKLVPSFATAKFIELMGSYYPKRYMRHLYTDNMYQWIGDQVKAKTGLQIIHYLPEVFIEHRHFFNNKAEVDKGYQETNNTEAYQRDYQLFEAWKAEQGVALIARMCEYLDKTLKK
jgi:hypothetical protein